jgi:hypothetical protein
VHQPAVHTAGGVIADGEPIMRIVPQADTLLKPIVDQAYRAFREK